MKHCQTCTCDEAAAFVTGWYCSAEVVRLHETFECLEKAGHEGPHRGAAVTSPCVRCGGVDVHADWCGLSAETWTGEWQEVVWFNGGEARIVELGAEVEA